MNQINATFTDSTGITYTIFLEQDKINDILSGYFPNELSLRFSLISVQKKDFEVKFSKFGQSYFSEAFTDEENILLNHTIDNIVNEHKRFLTEESFNVDDIKKYNTEIFPFEKIIQESFA